MGFTPDMFGDDPGVGGRQVDTPLSVRGGGYPNICKKNARRVLVSAAKKLSADDLRRMGVSRVWVKIARAIGVEKFLAVWHALASDESVQDDDYYVYVPRYSTYQRALRDAQIRELADQGLDAAAIQSRLRQQGIELSIDSIKRLMREAHE